jgi:hypothetical protein
MRLRRSHTERSIYGDGNIKIRTALIKIEEGVSRMRIAFISDIHGNSIALDAVLADIEARGGVDAYWLLGDF